MEAAAGGPVAPARRDGAWVGSATFRTGHGLRRGDRGGIATGSRVRVRVGLGFGVEFGGGGVRDRVGAARTAARPTPVGATRRRHGRARGAPRRDRAAGAATCGQAPDPTRRRAVPLRSDRRLVERREPVHQLPGALLVGPEGRVRGGIGGAVLLHGIELVDLRHERIPRHRGARRGRRLPPRVRILEVHLPAHLLERHPVVGDGRRTTLVRVLRGRVALRRPAHGRLRGLRGLPLPCRAEGLDVRGQTDVRHVEGIGDRLQLRGQRIGRATWRTLQPGGLHLEVHVLVVVVPDPGHVSSPHDRDSRSPSPPPGGPSSRRVRGSSVGRPRSCS